MDSITQILLGASVAAAIAPPGHRRAALLAGAALGTVPDLDGLVIALFTEDPVARMTLHRGISHSLLALPLLGWLLWWLFRRRGKLVAAAPRRWFWAIQLALLTHPLLDAFTVYGTQLLWPIPLHPAMWSSVFIIDPLYTLWLLIGVAVAAVAGPRPGAQRALMVGLVLSTGYLGWSLVAKSLVEREAGRSLAAIGLQDAPRFSVPMPFNTLLWRVVAMMPDGYVEGEHSLAADRQPMVFRAYRSDMDAWRAVEAYPAVQRLQWFNRGFMKVQQRDGQLVLSDLRMGSEPDYSFNFAVASREGAAWRPVTPTQLSWPWTATQRLPQMWQRIWHEPDRLAGEQAAP